MYPLYLTTLPDQIPGTDIKVSVIQQFFEQLPGNALKLGVRVLLAILFFILGVQLVKLIRKILKKALTKGKADKGVVQFLDSFVKAALYVLLIFGIASWFGVDAASIVALIGSAGVAIGLAVQGSLSNLAGGVLILLLKPFKVDDYIKDASGNEGTVTEISMFYTKLTTFDNRVIVLPNGTLANNSIINITHEDDRRLDIMVGIAYDADVKRAKEVLIDLLKEDPDTIKNKEINVFVDELAASSVNLCCRFWIKKENYWTAKWRLTEQVKYTLDRNGIRIPFNQLDVHLDTVQEEDKPHARPVDDSDDERDTGE